MQHIVIIMVFQLSLAELVLPSRKTDRLVLQLSAWLCYRVQGRLGPKIGWHDLAHFQSHAILKPTAAIAVGSGATYS